MKKLGFGFMRLPLLNKDDETSIDVETAKKMVDEFMSHGFTYFDTAYVYNKGASEKALNEALVKRYPRDSFTIASKLPISNSLNCKEDMAKIFNETRERLGVDYLDYYLLHALNRDKYKKVEELNAFGYLKELKEQGKIKHIGFSFHDTADILDKILSEHKEVEFVLLQINYLDWNDDKVQSKACYETATKHGVKVRVMEPLKGGRLANVNDEVKKILKEANPNLPIPSFGIRFAASLENVEVVLSGMSSLEQINENISYMNDFKPLSKKEEEACFKAADKIRSQIKISCTDCRYCLEGCPKQIPIPRYFALYNNSFIFEDDSSKDYYQRIILDHAKASDCIKCGKCEKTCPQHLQIRNYLKDIALKFE